MGVLLHLVQLTLNGLLLIDDTKDDDTREHTPKTAPKAKTESTAPVLTLPEQISLAINQATTLSGLEAIVTKIEKSDKLTDTQKENLISEATFKSEELSTNVLN